MPVPLRTPYHKAEARYNVTTEFPALGLHSAAANGNVGLVEYALDHGQPVNSVLDGVLPLHAACAGGNVQVVKLLIDHGADVNAPRLPRRYSNDKNRDASAPIVGSSGSTPLHFAAANGNTDVVVVLLHRGAHADRPDKHGITPEMLARQNGWMECAKVLKSWLVNKDKDLRERERPVDDGNVAPSNSSFGRGRIGSFGSEADTGGSRRRIHVKQSFDNAINMLKSSSTNLSESYRRAPIPSSTSSPPASSPKPLGEYTFYSPDDANGSTDPIDQESRRPSLPHILHPQSDGPSQHRRVHTSTTATPMQRRPRSAGTGAEASPTQESGHAIYGRGGAGRKLGSKYSLMNLFRKGQPSEEGTLTSTDGTSTLHASILSSSPPAFRSTTTLPLSSNHSTSSPSHSSNADYTDLGNTSSSISGSPIPNSTLRFHRGSDASTRTAPAQMHGQASPFQRTPSTNHRSPRAAIPLAVELHNALAHQQHQQRSRDRSRSTSSRVNAPTFEDPNIPSPSSSPLSRITHLRGHKRDRSGSASSIGIESNSANRSAVFLDDDYSVMSGGPAEPDSNKPPTRPGILRGHNRTSSGGQGTTSSGGFRSLRFDPMSASGDVEQRRSSPHTAPVPLKSSNSTGSLKKSQVTGGTSSRNRPGSAGSSGAGVLKDPISAPAVTSEYEPRAEDDIAEEHDLDDEDDEFEYGQPIHDEEPSPGLNVGIELPESEMAILMRQRGMSFTSSQSSLSPILSNDGVIRGEDGIKEFPFSINRPPPLPLEKAASAPTPDRLNVPVPDGRGRGDSLSSTSTNDSQGKPQLSSSGTTSGSTESLAVATPAGDLFLSPPIISKSNKDKSSVVEHVKHQPTAEVRQTTGSPGSINERRSHMPLDIDISLISSHAQAEALVQRARQEVLEMASTQDLASGTTSTNQIPLSARLAALGESLELERKLREQKEASANQQSAQDVRAGSDTPKAVQPFKGRNGVERQLSLESKSDSGRLKLRMRDPRRPSTADGAPSRTANASGDPSSRFYLTSRSASGSGHLRPSAFSAGDADLRLRDVESYPHSSNLSLPPELSRDTLYPNHSHGPDRPRTPVPRLEPETLSRMSSLENLSTDTEMGFPLERISTTPVSGPAAMRGKREQSRSAKKLARMGFSPAEQASRTPPPSSKRFGAIRSLVQTFKGKA